ncbi:MAG TPA: hypothetical protein VME66_02305 [Candidatus Acidoferrales bacterium]|nr:hypothetical protein [Candidatus Acidoferrales bacterium]
MHAGQVLVRTHAQGLDDAERPTSVLGSRRELGGLTPGGRHGTLGSGMTEQHANWYFFYFSPTAQPHRSSSFA